MAHRSLQTMVSNIRLMRRRIRTVVNDVAEIVYLGTLDGLFLHEVVLLKGDVIGLKFLPVGDHALHEWQVLCDNTTLKLRPVLP